MALQSQDREGMWEQKHRPSAIEGVILPTAMRNEIATYVEKKSLPHLLLDSPSPGTGKTTTAIAIAVAMECLKPMIINASKDTDIGTIRTKVHQYATGSSLINRKQKIVILDEVDRLSTQAQEALKGIMEEVSHVCSFILTTNHSHRIEDPLKSRCTPLLFTFTSDDMKQCAVQFAGRCCDILDQEGVTYDRRVVAQIIMQLAPDYRRVIKLLQQMTARYGEIGTAALGDLKRHDLSNLVESLRDQKYADILKWTTEHAFEVGAGFYRQLYDALKPAITPQSIASLIVLLGEEQKDHIKAPDMFLHLTRVLTLVMGDVEFKDK